MNRRLRIGMYTTVGPRCGIASYTKALTEGLMARADVTTVPLKPGSINPWRQVAAARRLAGQDIAHLQHTYSFFGIDQLSYTIMLRTLIAGIQNPLVLTAHTVREPGPSRFEGGLGSRCANAVGAPAWLDVKTFQRPDAVIVHAQFHKERLVTREVEPGRVHVIPPGIPPRTAVAASEVDRFRTRFEIPVGKRCVGVVGFLERSKRFSDLLGAVAQLPERPMLLIAGGPRVPIQNDVQHTLLSEAETLGIAELVRITGYLDPREIPIALEAMDLVVVPYGTDHSMSYSLHLALGQSRPVIATDLATIREVQMRGHCLELVPPEDPLALSDTLARLLDSDAARARLSTAALDYSSQENVALAAARTLEVYECLRKDSR